MNLTKVGLVAVGDSLTEGAGDPGRAGLNGWIHHLTSGLDWAAELTVIANLARTGATVAALRRSQLDRAVALAPDIVTCVIGVNDVLGGNFDAAVFDEHYDHVVDSLAEAAERGVLTMTLHDVGAGLPLPSGTRAELRRRIEQANAVIERVSERHGAWMIEARSATPMNELGMLSIDRLHPNRRGHRYLAAVAAAVLREHGVLVRAAPEALVPPADPILWRVPAEARHVLWVGRHIAWPMIKTQLRPAIRRGTVVANKPSGRAGQRSVRSAKHDPVASRRAR